MNKSRILAIAFVTAVFGVVVMSACSQQKEGEVCDHENGNDDCDTDNNLACYLSTTLNNVTSDRCCPVNRALATHPACIQPVSAGISDAAAPSNTGLPDSGASTTTDAGASDSGSAADAADQ